MKGGKEPFLTFHLSKTNPKKKCQQMEEWNQNEMISFL